MNWTRRQEGARGTASREVRWRTFTGFGPLAWLLVALLAVAGCARSHGRGEGDSGDATGPRSSGDGETSGGRIGGEEGDPLSGVFVLGGRLEAPALRCPAGEARRLHLSGDEVMGGFGCLLYEDGQLGCWGPGYNYLEEASVPDGSERWRPLRVPGVGAAADVALANDSLCFVGRGDGLVRCTIPEFGKLGLGVERWPAVRGVERPRSIAMAWPGLLDATLARSGCAVLADGTVRCWQFTEGAPFETPRTDEERREVARSLARPIDSFPIDGVTGALRVVGAGEGPHFCALTEGGAVLCWGEGESGQLGTAPSAADCGGPYDPACWRPRRLVESGAVDVAVGAATTCVLLGDEAGRPRRVRCWGDFGEAAGGWCADCRSGEPNEALLDRDALQIAAGGEHVCVLLEDGTVRCWGSNRAGQLGDGSFMAREPIGADPGLRDVRQVAAGRLATCALGADGVPRCWGEGTEGLLGRRASSSCASITGAVSYPCDPNPAPVEGLCGS